MKIDSNIAPPEKVRGRPRKYPFYDMDVGDSVFFEGEKISSTCKPYIAANGSSYRTGYKFSARTMNGGVRIWRVA